MTRDQIKRALDEMDPAERRKLLAELDDEADDNMVPSERLTEQDEKRLGRTARDSRLGYDASTVALAFDAAPGSAEGQRALRLAMDELSPVVGQHVVARALDAEGAYRLALDSLGVNSRNTHRDALPHMWRAAVQQQRATMRRETRTGVGGQFTPTLAGDGINGVSHMPRNVAAAIGRVRTLG